MKRQMKDSGIEWIGQIPEEWHVSKIKNVYIVILGKMLSPSQTQKDQTLENYLCAANIKWSGVDTSIQKQMWFSESDKAEYKLHEGDILIMEGGLAGTSCKYRGEMAPCFIQNSVHCCRAKSNYSNQFLYYWMNVVYNSKYIENICNKATIQHYTKEKVMNTPFLICSSLEQEKIVSYLDRKCAQIDAIIAKQQQIIEKLKEYKLSVITEAVTKGLDPNVPMKDSGVEWIEEIPEKWQKAKLKNTCQFINGDRSSNYPSPNDYVDKGIPFLGADSLCGRYVDIAQSKKITNEKYRSMGGAKIQKGDILYTLRGSTIGKNAMAMFDDGTVASSLMVIRPISLVPGFLLYWLNSEEEFQQRQSYINGSTAPNLSADNVGTFILFLPSTVEQLRIANFLDKKCNEIELAIQKKQRMIEKLSDYKKSLIYEVVTGKKEV